MLAVSLGNLPMDVRERDVEDLFYKFGRIREIDLKTPMRPPAYAFISFEDFRDAQDAVRERCVVLALLLLQPYVKGWQFQGVRSCSMALRRDVWWAGMGMSSTGTA